MVRWAGHRGRQLVGPRRAYLRNPAVRLPPLRAAPADAPGRLSLAAAVGRGGIVHVVRDLGLRETFSGETPIMTGEIDDDVEHYLIASEQIDSALACDGIRCPARRRRRDDRDRGWGPGPGAAGHRGADVVAAARERLREGALTRALATHPMSAEALPIAALGDAGPDLRR